MTKLTSEQRSDRLLLLLEWIVEDGMSAISDAGVRALAELRADRAARSATVSQSNADLDAFVDEVSDK